VIGTEDRQKIANKLQISIRTLERTKKKYYQYKKLTRKYFEHSEYDEKKALKSWVHFEFLSELNDLDGREEIDIIRFVSDIQRYFEVCIYNYSAKR